MDKDINKTDNDNFDTNDQSSNNTPAFNSDILTLDPLKINQSQI